MTIEDTVPDTMPAEDTLLPGVKPATTWRRRFLRFNWRSELAAMPGIVRAADQHLCPAGAEDGARDE